MYYDLAADARVQLMEVPVEPVPGGPLFSLSLSEENFAVFESGSVVSFISGSRTTRVRNSRDIGGKPTATEFFEQNRNPYIVPRRLPAGDDHRFAPAVFRMHDSPSGGWMPIRSVSALRPIAIALAEAVTPAPVSMRNGCRSSARHAGAILPRPSALTGKLERKEKSNTVLYRARASGIESSAAPFVASEERKDAPATERTKVAGSLYRFS